MGSTKKPRFAHDIHQAVGQRADIQLDGAHELTLISQVCSDYLKTAPERIGIVVRNPVISHVTEQMDVPSVRERLIREMAAIYAGNLFFGEDLMEIPVRAPEPAKLD